MWLVTAQSAMIVAAACELCMRNSKFGWQTDVITTNPRSKGASNA
jgi:hypothetical protein